MIRITNQTPRKRLLLGIAALVGLLLALLLKGGAAQAQSYKYESVPGDPLGTRIYTLANGLKVYLSVNKAEPRIYTAIAVRAGSKFDPADNTGLAHYLEHMLFKGTDKFGTNDFAKEKIYLAKIDSLYDVYNQTTDPTRRKAIYREIDSVSSIAAQYAIPNEYDKMVAQMGAVGTNAFTSNEMTVYINDIPANEVEKWLIIESDRFQNPVFRLFHTELEAVYEEKNISLDNDNRRVYETALASIFPNHPYGQQTTIGTIEHLKNPSLKKIRAYFDNYYVPNNVAVVMSGDLDPDKTIALIDKYFGGWKSKPVQPFTPVVEKKLYGPIEHTVVGPDKESVLFGFRIPGLKEKDFLTLVLIEKLLNNGTSGLIDLRLKQQQKVLDGYAFVWELLDYSMFFFGGQPLQGQDLKQVQALLWEQIDALKKGDFDATLIPAIVKNMRIDDMKAYEKNQPRTFRMVDAFIYQQNWADIVAQLETMKKITKDDVVKAANQYFPADGYVVVYKLTGDKPEIAKVEKPTITPVPTNADLVSPFVEKVTAMKAQPISPVFVDYNKDIQKGKLTNGAPLHYVQNKDNELFTLYYLFDFGRRDDKELAFAVEYLNYLGTDKLSPAALKEQFYKLGCSFGVSATDDQIYVYLSGLNESFTDGLKLFEEFLAKAKPDAEALKGLVERTLKDRQNKKLDKAVILRQALRNYATYGALSPFTNILSEKELKALKPEALTDKIHKLTGYAHRVLYYGPATQADVASTLNKLHKTPAKLAALTTKPALYTRQATPAKQIYFVHYNMVQAELMWLHKSVGYDPLLAATAQLYNEYFGVGMSSIVFQQIRESKALAYSSNSYMASPTRKEDPFYNIAYIGTQADKLFDALDAMNGLLGDMPQLEINFQNARLSVVNSIATQRVNGTAKLFSLEDANKLGLTIDPRSTAYDIAQKLTLADLVNFQKKHIAGQPHVLLLLADREKIDFERLKQYGTVSELSLEQIFGY